MQCGYRHKIPPCKFLRKRSYHFRFHGSFSHHLAALGGKAGIRTEYQRLFSEQGIAQLKIAVMKALGLLRDIHNLTIFLGALHNVVGPSGVVNILSLEQPSDFLYEHDGAEDRADASAVGLMAALRGVDDEVIYTRTERAPLFVTSFTLPRNLVPIRYLLF
jgi:hypothetical protein